VTAARGVDEGVGDDRQKEKDDWYTEMAERLDMRFGAVVLYTYGGFHRSALSFIHQLSGGYDPAVCLLSLTEWKRSIMENIAIAVQRGTADIMIKESQRERAATLSSRRRRRPRGRRFGCRSYAGSARPAPIGRGGEGGQSRCARAEAQAAELLDDASSAADEEEEGDLDAASDADTVVVAQQVEDDAGVDMVPDTPPMTVVEMAGEGVGLGLDVDGGVRAVHSVDSIHVMESGVVQSDAAARDVHIDVDSVCVGDSEDVAGGCGDGHHGGTGV
jgi:hypothetical protein